MALWALAPEEMSALMFRVSFETWLIDAACKTSMAAFGRPCLFLNEKRLDMMRNYSLTPAAAANPSDCPAGIVLAGGGAAKEESLALIAPE
jgi:hypothetical protein